MSANVLAAGLVLAFGGFALAVYALVELVCRYFESKADDEMAQRARLVRVLGGGK